MRLKRCITASATALFFCFSSFAQDGATGVTAEELVKAALEQNQELLAARERVAETEALLRQAGVRPAPTIEVETSTGRVLGSRGESEYSTAFFQPIETSGKRSRRVAVAEKGLAIAQAGVKERERQLRFDIKLRFVAAALQDLKLEVIRGLVPLNEENYRLTVQRVGLGDAAPLEQQLLLIEINRAGAQQNFIRAESEAAIAELRAVVGAAGAAPERVEPDFRLPGRLSDLKTLQEMALQQRGDLQILRLLEEQAIVEREAAAAEGRPDLTVSARYTRTNSAFEQSGFSDSGAIVPLRDSDNIVTFGISIPLFTRDRVRGTTQAAESRQLQQHLRREHLTRIIPQEVEAAYRRWEGAMRSIEILRTGVIDLSERNLVVIREAYRLGEMRLLDVLNEQRRLADMRLSYVEAQAEAARAVIELERAVGGPLL